MKPKHRLFHSYTLRLAALYAVIFSISTLFLFYFFYLFTASYMTQQMDDTIEAEIQGLAERYGDAGLFGLVDLIGERLRRQKGTGNSIYLLTTYNLAPMVGNLDRWPKHASIDDDWLEFPLEVNEQTGETHLARAKIFRLPSRHGLLVGRDVHQLVEAKRRIVKALAWGLAIMLPLAFFGGMLLSRRSVKRIEHINQTARDIMAGDLSQRVPLTNRNDDFDQLADNLNHMLDRIQTLMEDVRRVTDNIAHDLRTPLARLRQHLEDARKRRRPAALAQSLESAIKEADSLLSTFGALLRIARIESGGVVAFDAVDLAALMHDIVEFYEPLAEEKQQQLTYDFAPQCFTGGDRDLLFQSVANLIENAVKYAPQGGRIHLSLAQAQGRALISVADNGPGVPAAERKNVFRRFYRLDISRSTGGNGLGLSMVQAIIGMHNGAIDLRDNQPGLKVTIALPAMSRPLASPGHARDAAAKPAPLAKAG